MYASKGNHIITCNIEHKAVLDTCKHIEKEGGEVTYLKVKDNGLIDLAELEAAIKPNTILIAIMYANNEIGTIMPMKEISAIARVTSPRFVPYFIFRDPRDVVVSHVFYVTDMEARHVHHAYYQSLPDFNARLTVSILGKPDASVEFLNIGDRFAPYLGWLAGAEGRGLCRVD